MGLPPTEHISFLSFPGCTGAGYENTKVDSTDFRNVFPRFSPEARKANQALVDLLGTLLCRMIALARESLSGVKRSTPFLHYPYKWKTSRCTAMSHSLGSQPGNSRLRSSKVPEPKGKRLRRFVHNLLLRLQIRGADRTKLARTGLAKYQEFHSSQCALSAPSRRPDDFAAGTRF